MHLYICHIVGAGFSKIRVDKVIKIVKTTVKYFLAYSRILLASMLFAHAVPSF